MSKKTIKATVMNQIINDEIKMKPRWYFVVGSALMGLGLIGLTIGTVFLFNLSFFFLRQHGPMAEWRLQVMLEAFPFWIPIVAFIALFSGVFLLKKFDFSYKNNFLLIVISFITSIVLAGFIIDYTGINDTWLRRGQVKKVCLLEECISEQDTNYLKLALADERKALATYQATIAKFGPVNPFVNIVHAEEQHINMLLALFVKYHIAIPEEETIEIDLPDTLQEVCALGVSAEIDNDALYQMMIPQIKYEDIRTVFEALASASKNKHLPAFERCQN